MSNEIADKLARGSSIQKFVRPEPSLGVSRQNIKNKKKSWVDKPASGIVTRSLYSETDSGTDFGP
jgi:hypothetical protein